MAANFTGGVFQAVGAAGLALPGALLYTYTAGTLTPLATYTNQGGGSSNANPVVCDAAGQAAVWLGTSSYRMILKTAAGVTVWDVDNISTFATLIDFANITDDSKGANLIQFSHARAYGANTIGRKHKQRVDVRDAPWNAPRNGIADDRAAVQACIDYYKPYAQYNPTGIEIMLGAGQVRLDSGALDVTDCHGLTIRGDGRGATQLQVSTNNSAVRATNTSSTPLSYFVLKDLTIKGPGAANANAHGVDFSANNNCVLDIRVWACRAGIRLGTSYETTLQDIRIDGLGTLACYDGIYMIDGELAVAENAVEILGGLIYGAQRYGLRGECVTGSKVFGLEVLGCGDIGVYLGDSPGSKDLKWFTWAGGLIDTCKDLLVVTRGTSTVGELMHFSGLWMGYANDAADGIGADFRNMRDVTFSPDLMVNVGTGVSLQSVSESYFHLPQIKGYDRLAAGRSAVVVIDSTDNTFSLGRARKTVGSPTTNTVVESGTSDRNEYIGCNADGLVVMTGASSRAVGGRMVVSGTSINTPDKATEFTVATLPAASAFWKGRQVAVTNETGGYTFAFCDGTNWRRVQDRVVVS